MVKLEQKALTVIPIFIFFFWWYLGLLRNKMWFEDNKQAEVKFKHNRYKSDGVQLDSAF